MSGRNHTAVFGILASRHHAEIAADALVEAGLSIGDISVIIPQGMSTRTGGALGSTLGLLAGWGAVDVPGLGPVVAAGPLMSALAGVGAVGAAGVLLGVLVGCGVPEYEAKRYQGRVKSGSVLLSVDCPSPAGVRLAMDVLEQTGAEDVDSAIEISGVAQTGAFMQPSTSPL